MQTANRFESHAAGQVRQLHAPCAAASNRSRRALPRAIGGTSLTVVRGALRAAARVVPLLSLCAVWLAPAAFAESLYDPIAYRSLAIDHRAYRPGDTVTVLIFESASATSSADSAAHRSSRVDVSATDLHNIVGGNFSTDNEFQGGGVERRTGEVVARVSVTVVEVLPNGDLRVKGEQNIRLNTESQRISVEGRLRPEDILSDNTVLSSRLAEANIDFKGRGLLSSREKPGWLVRFFQWLL